MARIHKPIWLPFFRHCQGEAHTHIVVTRRGEIARQGRGLGFWFRTIGTAISEVPINDQSVTAVLKARTRDFQDVTIDIQIWYTVDDPARIATRFDFSLDTASGAYNADPLTVIQGALASAAQESVWSHVAAHTLESLLQSELSGLSQTVDGALAGLNFGLTVNRAVVTSVRPARDIEKALQTKTLERLQMDADAATFERRAKATEQERAIQEAELANRLALAQQQRQLIDQQDANMRAQAETKAGVARIAAAGTLESARLEGEQMLDIRRKNNEEDVAQRRRMGDVQVDETERMLALYEARPDAGRALALGRIPDALSHLEVLSVGDGGMEAALQRLANKDL